MPQRRFDRERDRWFESGPLQLRVCEPSVPLWGTSGGDAGPPKLMSPPSPGRSTTVNARAASLDYAAAPEELEGFANEDHRSARVHRDNRVAPAVGGCALAGLSAAPKGRRRSSIAAASRPRGPGPEARGQNHTLEAAPKGTNPMYRLPGWRRLDPIRDTLNDGGLDAEIAVRRHRLARRRLDLVALDINHLFTRRTG